MAPSDAVAPPRAGRDRATVRIGAAALAAWAVHAADQLRQHHPENLLWCCHVGGLGVAIGLILRAPRVLAPAAFLSLLGVVMWPIDVIVTGDLEPSSAVAHVAGIALGLAGIRRLGLPRGTWLRAGATLFALTVAARLVTPPAENVNLAFAVHPSLAGHVQSHGIYVAGVGALVLMGFFALDRALRATGVRTAGRHFH